MKKIVITGGLGFIGSNLVDFFIEKEYEVFVIDKDVDSKYYNFKAKYFHEDITQDISNHKTIFENTDAVFHLAAEIFVQKSIKDPDLFIKTNVDGTVNILKYCNQYGIKNLVFSSTSAVYGNSFNGIPMNENNEIDCLNAYAKSKYMAEQKLLDNNNMNISILRYFNVYGKRQHQDGQYAPVVGNFLKQKINGLSITIYGDGSKKRDFVNVEDVCLANYKAYLKNKGYNIYNVGSGENISILELAKLVDENIIFLEEKKEEANVLLANIDKAKKMLDWKPTVFIKEYISNIDIFKN